MRRRRFLPAGLSWIGAIGLALPVLAQPATTPMLPLVLVPWMLFRRRRENAA